VVGVGRFPGRSGRAGARGGGDATEPTPAARVPAVWDRHRHPYRHQRWLAGALAARGRLRVIGVACGTGRIAACRAACTERRASRSPLQLRYPSRHGHHPEGAERRLTGRSSSWLPKRRNSPLVRCGEWRVLHGRSGRAAWRLSDAGASAIRGSAAEDGRVAAARRVPLDTWYRKFSRRLSRTPAWLPAGRLVCPRPRIGRWSAVPGSPRPLEGPWRRWCAGSGRRSGCHRPGRCARCAGGP
jgi:hypothetical protein